MREDGIFGSFAWFLTFALTFSSLVLVTTLYVLCPVPRSSAWDETPEACWSPGKEPKRLNAEELGEKLSKKIEQEILKEFEK